MGTSHAAPATERSWVLGLRFMISLNSSSSKSSNRKAFLSRIGGPTPGIHVLVPHQFDSRDFPGLITWNTSTI